MTIPTPEHDKLTEGADIRSVSDLSAAIGEFVDWLPSQGIVLAVKTPSLASPYFVPARGSIATLLARYFGVDERALEAEKRALLAAIIDAP